MDEPTSKLLKVVEDRYAAIKTLSNKLKGYYTCTRFLLERTNPNLVESQRSSFHNNCDYYELKTIN